MDLEASLVLSIFGKLAFGLVVLQLCLFFNKTFI